MLQISSKLATDGAIVAACALYAGILNTERGQMFERDDVSRWAVVSVGVAIVGGITMMAGKPFPWRAFVLGGIPFMLRAVYRGVVRYDESLQQVFDG